MTIPKGQTFKRQAPKSTSMLTCTKDGESWTCPAYFDTPEAQQGIFYFMFLGDRFVLFCPPKMEHTIADMQTGKRVWAAFGVARQLANSEVWRLVFDDFTQTPFVLWVPWFLCGIEGNGKGIIDVRARDGIRLSLPIDAEDQGTLSKDY